MDCYDCRIDGLQHHPIRSEAVREFLFRINHYSAGSELTTNYLSQQTCDSVVGDQIGDFRLLEYSQGLDEQRDLKDIVGIEKPCIDFLPNGDRMLGVFFGRERDPLDCIGGHDERLKPY